MSLNTLEIDQRNRIISGRLPNGAIWDYYVDGAIHGECIKYTGIPCFITRRIKLKSNQANKVPMMWTRSTYRCDLCGTDDEYQLAEINNNAKSHCIEGILSKDTNHVLVVPSNQTAKVVLKKNEIIGKISNVIYLDSVAEYSVNAVSEEPEISNNKNSDNANFWTIDKLKEIISLPEDLTLDQSTVPDFMRCCLRIVMF